MQTRIKLFAGLAITLMASSAAAQVSLYEADGFRGRVFGVTRNVTNLERLGFNDRASSVIVERGRWEVCTDANFSGRCVVLRPGSYSSLTAMGLDNRISSLRTVNRQRYDNEAPPPQPAPAYDYRRRPNERLYEANVTSVRAVVGPPEQRCWVEREQVSSGGGSNVGGAIIGGLIGGILGHQVGSGRGNDAATALGAVAGAAIGSKSGNSSERNIQRCRNVTNSRAEYWDVDYEYRGRQYSVQMSSPPGRTILVNRDGTPRT